MRINSSVNAHRQLAGVMIGLLLFAILVPSCVALRTSLTPRSDLLLFLVVVVICSLVGGIYPALAAAVVACLLVNYFLVPPIHRFAIDGAENILALIVFIVIAGLVSMVVDRSARRYVEVSRSKAQISTIATFGDSLLQGEQALPTLMRHVHETFNLRGVALIRRELDGPEDLPHPPGSPDLSDRWIPVATVGDEPCLRPGNSDAEISVGPSLRLVVSGCGPSPDNRALLEIFATQMAVAYEQHQLAQAAAALTPLLATDRMRAALLNAVSHDLRNPIASAKAAVSSLRSAEIEWNEADRAELLTNADRALDHLTALVGDLLDFSRVNAGALTIELHAVGVDDVVNLVVDHLANSDRVRVHLPPDLPEVLADAGLLARVVANVVENALRYSPAGHPVLICASTAGGNVDVRIIDGGPGIPVADREQVFQPFRRCDDQPTAVGLGVGLGLAIARGFMEAMSATITFADNPDGGLIAVLSLRRA